MVWDHGLIKYVDTKAKGRHKKNDLYRDFAAGVYLSEFIDCRYSQSCWYFRPSFVNCCPSNLLSVSISPHPPFPCENKYTVYTYTVCGGGYGVLGLRQINTFRKVPLQVNFFRWRHFALFSMSLIFLRLRQILTAQHYFEINKKVKEHIDVQEMIKVWRDKL